jgi:hypothetical protein
MTSYSEQFLTTKSHSTVTIYTWYCNFLAYHASFGFRPDCLGQLDDFETTCPASVMFWGCITYYGVGTLVAIGRFCTCIIRTFHTISITLRSGLCGGQRRVRIPFSSFHWFARKETDQVCFKKQGSDNKILEFQGKKITFIAWNLKI